MIYKDCSKCQRRKLLEEFHQGRGAGGRAAWCKTCVRAYKAAEWVPGREHALKKKRAPSHVVYVISNPAWPEWVRVGSSQNERLDPAKIRLRTFNLASPHRDYELHVSTPSPRAILVELKARGLLAEAGYEVKNEWVRCSPSEAEDAIKRAKRVLGKK